MNEVEILIDLIKNKEKLAAMLAPSFPIVYKHPHIIGKLKRSGFTYVVEVSAGAINTNKAAIKALKKDKKARFITSPCPSLVRMIRTKYSHLKDFLAFAADSPMVATAKIVQTKFPEYRPIFIGPCNVKTLEAQEDYPELNIVALTYRQLEKVFLHFNIEDDEKDDNEKFDIEGKKTRLYPISGGLAQSSDVKDILAEDELEVVSGWKECEKAIERFEKDDKIRLLDILYCEGGCINGPGIESKLSIDDRRTKIINYWLQEKIASYL